MKSLVRPFQCGIIGFGKMGQIRAKAIQSSGRGIVRCIYDVRKDVSTSFSFVDSPEELINSGVEAIFVCTPNYLIKPLVVKALQSGAHVFAEKPPGISLSETLEIEEALGKVPSKVLMFGFNHRHHGSIKKMKEIILSGRLGRMLWMRGRYGKEVDELFFQGWRAKKELAGGGIMLDQGIHMLDLMLYLGGDFDGVKSFVSNSFWNIEGIEDNVFAIFRNSKTGVSASLHSTMTQWRYLFSLEVFMEEGALILNGLKTTSGSYGDEDLAIKYNRKDKLVGTFDHEERIVYHVDTSWDSEIVHFFDCLEQNKLPEFGGIADAVKLMTIVNRIYEER